MTSTRRSVSATTGGRLARRLLVRLSAAALATITLSARVHETALQVAVREDRGTYHVSAAFVVPQSAAIAETVLRDYEQIPRFMPDVQKSVVVERSPGHVVVEQEAQSKVLFFSKQVHLRLDVDEQAGLIRFRDTCGKSFHAYAGQWTITGITSGTQVRYELSAKPAFSVPGFIISRLLKRDASRMIEGLRKEMAARAKQELGIGQ